MAAGVLDPDVTALLEAGCSIVVGVVGASGEPFATRGWSVLVLDGSPLRVRLLVGAAACARFGRADGGEPFPICLTAADVRTLRSVQLKGTVQSQEAVTADDLERLRRYCDDFFGEIEDTDGISPELMGRLVPADLVALTVEVDDLFDQTPGPAAGAPLHRP